MAKKTIFDFLVSALFCGCAMFMLASCSSSEDNAAGQPTTDIVAPDQLKQGIWTEYDTVLVATGKYTAEELARMPAVGMMVDGDKAYFFTYTAEGASDLVEGKISYDKSTGNGNITFPAIKDNPLSGQTVNFTATSDETLEFELTYEGQKTTATCAWLCENLDDWNTEITDEDWKELMAYYQTIPEEAGPDASIDWGDSDVEGLDQPLVWNEGAAAPAKTRIAIAAAVSMGLDIFSSLFKEDDPNAQINDKLDELMDKVDQVLANQQVMMQKLDEINERLKAIATKLNQQETLRIFNERNSLYFNPLEVQNVQYFKSAYELYTKNKGNLSQETKDKLGEYAKAWVGTGNAYANLTWNYMKYVTTVQHSTYGTGMDKIYDGLTFDKYPWEHMGIGDRQSYRAYDLIMIAKSLFMINLYAQFGGLTDTQKEGLYNAYSSYTSQLRAFCKFEVTDPDKFLVCQIPGAHFVMNKEVQEYNYGDKGSDAPDERCYGRDAIYMPRWHVAGTIKISNPAEMKTKLIPMSKMNAIIKYFEPYQVTWYDILIQGHKNSGGAFLAHELASPAAAYTSPLLLYNNENVELNGVVSRTEIMFRYHVDLRMFSLMLFYKTHEHLTIEWLTTDKNEHKWREYNGPKQFYAAIVEKNF